MYRCKKCNKFCETIFGSGKFCSRKCSNSRERTIEVKLRISEGVRACDAYKEGRLNTKKGKSKYETAEKRCLACKSSFISSSGSLKKFCSRICANKSELKGGYRIGSGRSKPGWYEGFYCGSTWELAFLIWCLEHDIPIQRCNERFKYMFNNKKRTYLPDFKINDVYVEIKGYQTVQVLEKTSQFPQKLIILFKEDLTHVFKYVQEKYGKDYVSLYTGNPHNQRKSFCKQCGLPCKNLYCSRKCSMLGNKLNLATPAEFESA